MQHFTWIFKDFL